MEMKLKNSIKLFSNFKKDIRGFLLDLSRKIKNISEMMKSYLEFLKKKKESGSKKPSSKFLGRKRLKYVDRSNKIMSKVLLSSIKSNGNGNHNNNVYITDPIITGKVFSVNCVKANEIIQGYRLLLKYNKHKFYLGPYQSKSMLNTVNSVIQREISTIRCTKNNYRLVISECAKYIKEELNHHYPMLTLSKSGKKKRQKLNLENAEKNKDKEDKKNSNEENNNTSGEKENKYRNHNHNETFNNISKDEEIVEKDEEDEKEEEEEEEDNNVGIDDSDEDN